MANPWWLATRQVPVSYDTSVGDEPEQYDVRTGRKVTEQGGKYYYSLPTEGRYEPYQIDETASGARYVAPTAGEMAADAPQPSVQFVPGFKAPYGNLGGEVGTVDGKPAYLFPMSRGATPEGDIGTYGGAQRATWRSPSGAKGQVVRGPDGELWVAAPPDAQFGESDVADHSTVLGELQKTYGPLISAALMAPGADLVTGAAVPSLGSQLASSLGLGGIGGSAALGSLQSVLQGGDPLTGAAKGAIGGTVSELGGPILKDTGLSPEVSKAILGATTSALTGGNPLLSALSGLSPALTKTEGEITGPMAETPVMGSEGVGYPGADFPVTEPAPEFQPEPPSAIGYGDETQVSAPTGTPDVPPLGDVFNYPDEVAAPEDLAGADIPTPEPTVPEPPPGETPTATEAPELPPLEYTAPEEGVRIPEKLLAAALGIGQQTVPTATTPSPTGTQTRRLGSSDVGASSLAALGKATSPDEAVGAGELESTRTGKKRRNVWNVASLKNLQDALGV